MCVLGQAGMAEATPWREKKARSNSPMSKVARLSHDLDESGARSTQDQLLDDLSFGWRCLRRGLA